jgi:hypothetical protein
MTMMSKCEYLKNKKCDFCDRDADAYWMAERPILVCKWCASEHVLPKVVADSVANRINPKISNDRTQVFESLKAFEREFWRAFALAIMSKSDKVG